MKSVGRLREKRKIPRAVVGKTKEEEEETTWKS
jgi:hypothetical protein